jgi:hypothetical protein
MQSPFLLNLFSKLFLWNKFPARRAVKHSGRPRRGQISRASRGVYLFPYEFMEYLLYTIKANRMGRDLSRGAWHGPSIEGPCPPPSGGPVLS